MITATIFKEEGLIKGYKISGHADFAEYGSDIVCSAVSALAINCCNSICELTTDRPVIKSDDKNGGYLMVNLSHPSPECELLLKSFELGIKSVAEDYGKYVKIVYSDR